MGTLALMFDAVGITEGEERVYRELLERRAGSATEVARALSWTRPKVARILGTLEQKGLVSRSPGRGRSFVPAPPEVALEVLILRREEELKKARLSARQLAEDYAAARRELAPEQMIEVVVGHDAVLQRAEQLEATAQKEVLAFDKPPYVMDAIENPLELEALARGVRFRGVYEESALSVPGSLEHLRAMAAAGEEARTVSVLPMKLAIADAKLGLVPLRLSGSAPVGAVLVHASPLLDALVALFEITWERGVPLPLLDETADLRVLPTPDDRLLLALLAAGHKDQTVARELGIGVRTVERRLGRLMTHLGARTRFQAALLAAGQSWVEAPAGDGRRGGARER